MVDYISFHVECVMVFEVSRERTLHWKTTMLSQMQYIIYIDTDFFGCRRGKGGLGSRLYDAPSVTQYNS